MFGYLATFDNVFHLFPDTGADGVPQSPDQDVRVTISVHIANPGDRGAEIVHQAADVGQQG